MNDEARKLKSFKIKPSIIHKPRLKIIRQGKTLAECNPEDKSSKRTEGLRAPSPRAFLSPFIFSISFFLEYRWGVPPMSPQRRQREFVIGKEVWPNKLDACHWECEIMYAGVLCNKKSL